MYGAYHHNSVVGKEHLPHNQVYDVTDSLCESIDKFAIDRIWSGIQVGDLLSVV